VTPNAVATVGTKPKPLVPLPAALAVLLSGRGSNFEALADACARGEIPARIVLVASDVPSAAGLEKARARGIPLKVIGPGPGTTRVQRERELSEALEETRPDLLCLAGFMRILSAEFVARWPLRILNVHPSLLPSFPGLEAQAQALAYGVRVTGATVHFVDAGTDSGPIVAQAAVPVHAGDDAEALAARILPVEHALYAAAVRRVLEGGWSIVGRRVAFPES
jgi:phosphoribosylglycinamide formyltransferase-1